MTSQGIPGFPSARFCFCFSLHVGTSVLCSAYSAFEHLSTLVIEGPLLVSRKNIGNNTVMHVFWKQQSCTSSCHGQSTVNRLKGLKTGSGGVCCPNSRGRMRNRKSNSEGVSPRDLTYCSHKLARADGSFWTGERYPVGTRRHYDVVLPSHKGRDVVQLENNFKVTSL